MLADRYSVEFLHSTFLPLDQWKPFPTVDDRGAWDALLVHPLRRAQREAVVRSAESWLQTPIPILPTTLYLQFSRIGNRSNFETEYFARRTRLGELVIAECFENKGRFLDAVLDVAWAITEEATWSLPAHVHRVPDEGTGSLPRQDRATVDLFAAETALVLAEALYLLRSRFLPESRALVDRIEREIDARIVDELLLRGDQVWWKDGMNNWTPWCASNAIGAAMYIVKDPNKLARFVHQMMLYTDRFIDRYSDDGGCDEGPVYWSVSPGALFIELEFLFSRSNGQVTIYDQKKIHRMAEFVVDAHLDGPYSISFADSSPRSIFRPGTMSRVGRRIGSPRLGQLTSAWRREFVAGGPLVNLWVAGTGSAMTHYLRDLFWADSEPAEQGATKAATAWYPLIQVVVARQSADANHGLVFAAKGGHNAENHNHNDVGQFLLYLDGQPGIVDVGVESYSRKTFSDERYTIWCIRGEGHNPPVFQGASGPIEQVAGREFEATDVILDDRPEQVRFRVGMQKAYPAVAGLNRLVRTLTLDRALETFDVVDQYAFRETPLPIQVLLWSAAPVTLIEPGHVRIHVGRNAGRRDAGHNIGRDLDVKLESEQIGAQVFEKAIEDPWLIKAWGSRIWGILVQHRPAALAGQYAMRFSVAGK